MHHEMIRIETEIEFSHWEKFENAIHGARFIVSTCSVFILCFHTLYNSLVCAVQEYTER